MKKSFFKSVILAVVASSALSACVPTAFSTSGLPQPVEQNKAAK